MSGGRNYRLLLFFIIAAMAPAIVCGDESAYRRFGILCYSSPTPAVAAWIDRTFCYKIGGGKPASSAVKWMGYFDVYGTGTIPDYLKMKDFARRNGFDHEMMLLHASKNYKSTTVADPFREMDKFDAFEGKNGILKTKNNRDFKDHTAKAYRGDMEISDTVYIGYEEPFSDINFELSTKGKKVTATFEYWNGTLWSPLNVSDGTGGFTGNGLVRFTPPPGWEEISINGSRKKYFVRLVIADADRNPVSKRIYGESWVNDAPNACRGWDWASPAIKRLGKIIYNPHPPAHASARFPYQARIAFWGAGHFIANPADFQGGGSSSTRTWARFAAEEIVATASREGYAGIMCDDGSRDVAWDGIPAADTDFIRRSSRSWIEESAEKYRDIVNYVKEQNPAIKVGVNAQEKKLVQGGDWLLAEYHTLVWQTGNSGAIERDEKSRNMAYDDLLPQFNPGKHNAFMMYQDTADLVPERNASWDRGNRGPLTALSKHYIGANENIIFSYYSRGGYIYSETDEVYLKNGKVVHLSTGEIPSVDKVERWATYFPAMGIDIGVPDPEGFNKGKRDLHWKSGKEIGGGPDVWRRDFTKAIVLHRPAYWNTPATEYDRCSQPISLGGMFFPLRADGTVEAGTKEICLRSGDGAILLKKPLK